MKTISFFLTGILLLCFYGSDQDASQIDTTVLLGTWTLDMTPENTSDANFATMKINNVGKNMLEGFFYREGVKIRHGRINTQREFFTGLWFPVTTPANTIRHFITRMVSFTVVHMLLGEDFYRYGQRLKSNKMKPLPIILTCIVLSCGCTGQRSTNFVPVFKESKETTHKIPEQQRYTFGYLEVLENRNNPDSKIIKVPVYIFKSRSANPKPDPIIYTVGGPGYTSMRASMYMEYYRYLDDRDFILFEQRGTQFAKPNLACPEWSEAVYRSNLPDFDKSRSDSLFTYAAKACRARLLKKGIDLNGYNTNEIAADIEELRKVLGIERYNLLTISYSTKIAQVLMRDYPEGIRSVVMDSPLPLAANYDEESVANLLEAVEKILSDCASDTACNTAFPDLKKRFFKYLSAKTVNPLVVPVKNPDTGKEETFYLKGKDLITVVTSASTENVPNIPFEINKLLNDDLSTVKKQLSYVFQNPGNGNGIGMRLSVWCAEEFPFADQKRVKEETFRYPELRGLSPAVFDSSVCRIWGVENVPDIENEPVKSDIPVLLISGEYDNETPSKWAIGMQKSLTNSFHLLFKGWRHTPTTHWGNPCAMHAANDFFNNPDVKPNPDCFKDIKTPEFKIE